MASIAGIGCTFVKGQAAGLRQRVETWQQPGYDGYGAQILGRGSVGFEFAGILYGSVSTVVAWAALLEAVQGAVVTIVDDWSTTWTYCLITQVSQLERKPTDATGTNCRGEVRVSGVRV